MRLLEARQDGDGDVEPRELVLCDGREARVLHGTASRTRRIIRVLEVDSVSNSFLARNQNDTPKELVKMIYQKSCRDFLFNKHNRGSCLFGGLGCTFSTLVHRRLPIANLPLVCGKATCVPSPRKSNTKSAVEALCITGATMTDSFTDKSQDLQVLRRSLFTPR